MIISMTGFATITRELILQDSNKVDIVISLKSLNSRFFELTAKLPSQFTNLEVELNRILKKDLVRGHAFLIIKLQNQEQLKKPVSINVPIIETYIKELSSLKDKFSLPGHVDLELLLKLPHVISFEEKDLDENIQMSILPFIHEIVALVRQEQIKEGNVLHKELHHRLQLLKEGIAKLQILMAQAIETRHAHLGTLIEKHSLQIADSTEQQLAAAQKESLILAIEKTDITEEIVRFQSHLDHVKEVLDDTKEVSKGKKIDFLLQELHREINTISAKANHVDISHLAVTIKNELEKAKEQIQNII